MKMLNPAALDGSVASTQRPRQRGNGRNDAAVCIQKTFRGWRTRHRVVWRVREELSAFMTAMEQDVEVERVLRGLPKPQTSRWLGGGNGADPCSRYNMGHGVKKTLHLPRIEDHVLGLRFSFPLPQHELGSQPRHTETRDQGEAHVEITNETGDAMDNGDELEASLEPSAPQPPTSALEANHPEPPPNKALSEVEAENMELSLDVSNHEAHDEDLGASMSSDHSLASSRSDTSSAVVVEGSPAAATVTVDQILASHSKADILMELEWAKQALQDRLRYLHARQRSQS